MTASKPTLENSAIENWKRLTGTWYGHQKQTDGSRSEWILTRDMNGTYKFVSRIYQDNDQYDEWTEFGEWGLAGPIYFVTTKAWLENGEVVYGDMTDPYGRSAYQVLSLTESEFHYQAFSDGSEFRMIKKDSNFDFQD